MRKFILLIAIGFVLSCSTQTEKLEETIEPIALTTVDLQNKSLEELRLMRNQIFAEKGYIFKSEDLHMYFKTFDWYKPQYSNVDSLLTDLDRKNVQTIFKVENEKKEELERRMIRISNAELSEYQNAYDSAEKWDKQFISKLFQTIDQFKGRIADSTILTIGNIDGIGKLDTVHTHIYALDDTIHLESIWMRNGELLWSDNIKNPYLQINNDDIFAYDSRHPWVTFTIAINYGAPALSERNDYPGIDRGTALNRAKWYIERKSLAISDADYIQYFDSFKGQLFKFGEPEIRHNLLQWYEPKKQFILYYAP